MKKKKLAFEERMEEVAKVLDGATWEDVRKIGVRVLASQVAFEIHVKENKNVFIDVLEEIAKEANVFSQKNSFMLALAKTYREDE